MFKRSISAIVTAPFQVRHWRALLQTFTRTERPFTHIREYISRRSPDLPKPVGLRTPIGSITATIFHPDDRLTINEIFCRDDYLVGNDVKTVVDFGANIGISGLYFLSRNPTVHVYLVEPNPANVAKLREQVAPFSDRVTVVDKGVAASEGVLTFGFEPTGRYGGAGLPFAQQMDVPVIGADAFLQGVIAQTGVIDVLKIDIEALEEEVLAALSAETLSATKLILVEGDIRALHLDATHRRHRYGPITRFERRT